MRSCPQTASKTDRQTVGRSVGHPLCLSHELITNDTNIGANRPGRHTTPKNMYSSSTPRYVSCTPTNTRTGTSQLLVCPQPPHTTPPTHMHYRKWWAPDIHPFMSVMWPANVHVHVMCVRVDM
mmetsp:Transcript_31230/g.77351  ORF Transcript_31230/g.77351 Transcript_31230/m.77351 type:complete len:123 (+) Transcript_31230:3355-3723(+)